MMTKSTWGAAALLIATFAGGALVGGAAVAFAERGGHFRASGRSARGPNMDGYVEHLSSELSLNRTQKDSVRKILLHYKPAMDSVWDEVGPRLDTLRTRIRSEIRLVLTPEQQPRYTDMISRLEAERRRMGR
jgi:Spy/CpxP family protein refolding chaperone